jgi:hypothetical protein
MAVHIVKTELLINEKRERIVLMDDFGSSHDIFVPVLLGSTRQQVIQDHVTLMENHQAAMETYAKDNGHDISAQKVAGTARKQKLIEQNKPQPFVPTPAPTPITPAPVAVENPAPASTQPLRGSTNA